MAQKLPRTRRIWLPSFLGRFTSLLFALSLLILYFYVIGNLQGFTDTTLFFLLAALSWTLGLCTVFGVFSSLLYVLSIPLRNRLYLDRIIIYGAMSLFSILFYLVIALLQAFMEFYG